MQTAPLSGLGTSHTLFDVGSVVGGEGLLRIASFSAAVMIARLYGAFTFGRYATVLAIVTVAVQLSDNGIEVLSISDVSRHPHRADTLFGSRWAIKAVLSLLMIGVLVSLGLLEGFAGDTWLLATFLTTRTLLYTYGRLNNGFLKALNAARVIGTIQLVNFAFQMIAICACYLYKAGIDVLLACLIFGPTAELALSTGQLYRMGIRPRRPFLTDWRDVLRRGTPIGLSYTLAAVILRSDVAILAMVAPAAAVGQFAAADMGLVLSYAAAWLFGGVLLVRMSRLAREPEELGRFTRKWARLVLAVGVPVSMAAFIVAPYVIRLVYGKEFLPASPVASILALSLPLIFINATFLNQAIAALSTRLYLSVYAGTALLTVTLDFGFGRAWGPQGIAWAVLLRELVMCVIFVAVGVRSSEALPVEEVAMEARERISM